MRLAQPAVLHPVLQFRYTVLTSRLPGAALMARSAQQPSFENSPIKVEYGNSNFKVKGKTNWNDIQLTFYQFEGLTLPMFWLYMQQHQLVKFATDFRARNYKHDIQLQILNPMQLPVGAWKLRDAFYSSVDFGQMDWGSNEVTEINCTISYDYAEFDFFF